MAELYRGYWPTVVAGDAKYHVKWDGRVELQHWVTPTQMARLPAVGGEALGQLVNKVKHQPGGTFYLNEFGHVVVPIWDDAEQQRSCYYAGRWDHLLEFRAGDISVSPRPPRGLLPGDQWFGPHVGIPYVLEASGLDIRYDSPVPGQPFLINRVKLSRLTSRSLAERLARRLTQYRGPGGGRIYINEAGAFFAPMNGGPTGFRYLGMLADDAWFPVPPEG